MTRLLGCLTFLRSAWASARCGCPRHTMSVEVSRNLSPKGPLIPPNTLAISLCATAGFSDIRPSHVQRSRPTRHQSSPARPSGLACPGDDTDGEKGHGAPRVGALDRYFAPC